MPRGMFVDKSDEKSIKGRTLFCSWSGGKDCCLALYRAIGAGGIPRVLLTMLIEDGKRSRSHGLRLELIQKQAALLGLPLAVRAASWADYENNFVSALKELKNGGIEAGVFGDIDGEANRAWEEQVCAASKIMPHIPLWKGERRDLLNQFLDAGFKATIVAVKAAVLDKSFLGQTLDPAVIRALEKTGVDASGEAGEYHTVVTDGPLFSAPLKLTPGSAVLRDGCWFLDLGLA